MCVGAGRRKGRGGAGRVPGTENSPCKDQEGGWGQRPRAEWRNQVGKHPENFEKHRAAGRRLSEACGGMRLVTGVCGGGARKGLFPAGPQIREKHAASLIHRSTPVTTADSFTCHVDYKYKCDDTGCLVTTQGKGKECKLLHINHVFVFCVLLHGHRVLADPGDTAPPGASRVLDVVNQSPHIPPPWLPHSAPAPGFSCLPATWGFPVCPSRLSCLLFLGNHECDNLFPS